MTIDYSKQGLRLGYLIRIYYLDAGLTFRALRLSGPAERVGTGLARQEPDDPYADRAQRYYWRAGVRAPVLEEDIGKLNQHIQTLTRLTLSVPLEYPARASSEVEDTTGDVDLRAAVVSGRWANRDVDVWLIDLDTGDTEHRFRGRTDKEAQPGGVGSFSLSAVEYVTSLASRWKMGQVPVTTDGFTGSPLLFNAAGLYDAPTAYFLREADKGKWLGSVFGGGPAAINQNGPVWQPLVPYGQTTGWGSAPPIGNNSDPVYWFWVSPQYGCRVGKLRAVDDDGSLHENGGSVIGTAGLVGHNYDPGWGPLGTFVAFQFDTSSNTFDWADNNNQVWAAVYGPQTAGATANEWHATYGAPFTVVSPQSSDPTGSVEDTWDVLELAVEDAEYLGASNLFGPAALPDFAADAPSTVAGYAAVNSAVPVGIVDNPITYRDALTGLMAGLPADLVFRRDASVGERRLFPWWRRPRVNEDPDYTIRSADLAGLARPTVSQGNDPHNEYSNVTTVKSPDYVDQPTSVPFPATDNDLLGRRSRFTRRLTDVTEVTLNRNVRVETDRTWVHWSPKDQTSADERARLLASELSQPQAWVQAELGGKWFRLQLGDLVQYVIHGVTDAPGMVRGLEYDLERQTVTATTCHVTHYEGTEGGVPDDE